MSKRKPRSLARQLTFIDFEKSMEVEGEQEIHVEKANNFLDRYLSSHGDELSHCLDGKEVAIVVGPPSGLDVGLTKLLQGKGYMVALVSSVLDVKAQVTSELSNLDDFRFFWADIASYSSLTLVFSEIWRTYGRIDVVCVHAGTIGVDDDLGHLSEIDLKGIVAFSLGDGALEAMPPALELECKSTRQKSAVSSIRLATHFMHHNSPLAGGKIVVSAQSSGGSHDTQDRGLPQGVSRLINVVASDAKYRKNIVINAVCGRALLGDQYAADLGDREGSAAFQALVHALQRLLDDATGIPGQVLDA